MGDCEEDSGQQLACAVVVPDVLSRMEQVPIQGRLHLCKVDIGKFVLVDSVTLENVELEGMDMELVFSGDGREAHICVLAEIRLD